MIKLVGKTDQEKSSRFPQEECEADWLREAQGHRASTCQDIHRCAQAYVLRDMTPQL